MNKTPEQIVEGLEGDDLKEVFHLAGKKLGHHKDGGVTTQDVGDTDEDGSGDNYPKPGPKTGPK